MPRFFIAATNIFGGAAVIDGEDLTHIRALRIKRGECFTVCDGAGTDYICRLTELSEREARAEITETVPSRGEPAIDCAVYTAFSKSDRLEWVIQKTVELGASEIVLFPSSRCVARPEGLALIKKTARLGKLSEEAAKQSGRGRIPPVSCVYSFEDAIGRAAAAELSLFFYEDEKNMGFSEALKSKDAPRTVSVVTGPEGGFEPREAQYARERGMLSVSLGPRILRCDTAPVCAVSAVMLHTGNLG